MKLITFPQPTPDAILKHAHGELSEVTLIGRDKNGELYLASTKKTLCEVLHHLDVTKLELLAENFE